MAVKCGEANAQGKRTTPPAAMPSVPRNQKDFQNEQKIIEQIKEK